jgi:signal peptidase complex subunit 2
MIHAAAPDSASSASRDQERKRELSVASTSMAKKKNAAAAAAAAATARPVSEASSVAATAGDATLDTKTTLAGASKSSKSNRRTNEDDQHDDTDTSPPELELLQVDLGDMVKLKQVLDESVVMAMLQHVPEDYAWDNVKLSLMFVACVCALIAQFAPLPFPDCRPILGLCGALYFVLSGLLQGLATFIDKDTILWSSPVVPSKENTSKENKTVVNPDLYTHGVRVRSSLPRFSEWFTVTLELHDATTVGRKLASARHQNTFTWQSLLPWASASASASASAATSMSSTSMPSVSQTWSVGQFFDKDGYFDETGLSLEIDQLFARLDAGKYDTVASKAKTE